MVTNLLIQIALAYFIYKCLQLIDSAVYTWKHR